MHFDIGSVTLDYNKRHHHERRSQSLKKEKEKFDTPRFFQRVKISTLRSVWSCKKGQSCSHMCVIWKCLGCWLSCTTITTWNFKEGEKLLWFFGQQKKAELMSMENHPTKSLVAALLPGRARDHPDFTILISPLFKNC